MPLDPKKVDWWAEFNSPSATREQVPADRLEAPPSSAGSAGIGTIARVSLAEDLDARIKGFAEARGIPPNRYTFRNGAIAYLGDDGVVYREIPELSISSPMSIFKNIAAGFGNVVSDVPPMAVGAVTAPMFLAGPGGAAISTAATGGAAMAGQKARSFLAEKLVGPQDPGNVQARETEKTAAAMGAQMVGGALTRPVAPAFRHDMARLGQVLPGAKSLEAEALAEGLTLTPGQSTGLPSLLAQEKLTAYGFPATSDTMQAFYRTEAGKTARMVERFFASLGKRQSASESALGLRGAAGRSIKMSIAEREAAASPLYKQAFQEGAEVDVRHVIGEIDRQMVFAKGSMSKSLGSIRGYLHRVVEGPDPETGEIVKRVIPEDRIQALHQVKLAVDEMLEGAEKTGMGKTTQRAVAGLQKSILDSMDGASPAYKDARKAFASMSPPVDTLKKSIVGIIAETKDSRLLSAIRTAFSPDSSGPEAISFAKGAIKKANPAAWNDAKAAWLRSTWEQAGRETLASQGPPLAQGGKFRLLIMGDDKRREMLRAVLEPHEYRTLERLASFLEAQGRAPRIGSDTAWNQELQEMARSQAVPRWVKAGRALEFWNYVKLAENYFSERGMVNNAEKIAEVITQPGALDRINTLVKAKPGSAAAAAGFAQFLSLGARNYGSGANQLISTEGESDFLKEQRRQTSRRPQGSPRGPQAVPGLMIPQE